MNRTLKLLNKPGWQTTEFWTIITTLLALIAKALGWIDFPIATLVIVVQWVAGRGLEKALAPSNTKGKRAWQTSEFWLSLLGGGIFTIFPTLPIEAIFGLSAYLAGRAGIKARNAKG